MNQDKKTTCIALEIGGTKLQAALGTSAGEILELERGKAPAREGAKGIVAWFDPVIPTLMARANERGTPPRCIAIGFGGPVEQSTGRVLKSHQVSGWDNFPLKDHFERRFHLPTFVYNDSNAAGWGEYCLGAGKGTRQFCYMNIGSGIGGALVADGVLHNGQGLGAGEIGHTLVPDWTSAEPGAAVKLEDLCSGWAIESRMRAQDAPPPDSVLHKRCKGDRRNITSAMLGEAAKQGDAYATRQLEMCANSLGIALANVLTLFHPERIAVGGGVSLIGGPLMNPLRAAVDKYVFGCFRERYEIMPCQLGEDVVLAGALLLAGRERVHRERSTAG